MIPTKSLALLLVAGLFCACNDAPPPAPAPAPDKAAATPDTPAPEANKAAAPDGQAAPAPATGDACKDYANAICTEAGEKTSTCTGFRQATELMPAAACEAGIKDLSGAQAKLKALTASCDQLIAKLCGDLGEETLTCDLVRTKTKTFPPDRCKEMLGDEVYPQVIAELKAQEEQNKPLDAAKMALIAAPSGSEFGPADAKVVVVEFSDFECPYCSRVVPVANAVKEKYKGKVRFVFRHFPLTFHKNAHLASQAALAAGEQGKFWEFHDKLFENQRALTRDDLEKYAGELKLNMGKFKAALDSKKFAAAVDADLALGKTVSVAGTPSMFVNGARVANPSDVAMVTAAVDKALTGQAAP